MKKLLPLIFLFTLSCSLQKGGVKNETSEGHWQLYSMPSFEVESHSKKEQNQKRLVIASTANTNGRWNKQEKTLKSADKFHTIKFGGKKLLESYLDIIRKRFTGEMIYFDAGNFSDESNDFSTFEKLAKSQELQVANIGMGELENLKYQSSKELKQIIENSNLPLISSNIYDISNFNPIEWKNVNTYRVLNHNGLKIGVIGIISPTVSKKIKVEQFQGLNFDIMEKNILKYSRYAKRNGADIVVLMFSSSQECGLEQAKNKNLPEDKVNFDPTSSNYCNQEDEIGQLLKRLPKNSIDLVLASGGQTKIANFIYDTPVIRPLPDLASIGLVELVYDLESKKLLTDKTIVHQPIMLCENFIKQTQDCYWNDNSISIEQLEKARFLGLEIQ